jgi:hypothetical protein
VLDVAFDDRRIWSFWLHRDGVPLGRASIGGRYLVAWPPALAKFLDGRTRVTLSEHGGQRVFDGEVRLGSAEGRIAVVDDDGSPLALDKSLRRVKTFETRSDEQVAPLMGAIETVLAALKTAGVDAFLAYGTLLGAVRNGGLIGHDSDADLGYVSQHEHPIDVMRESFELQRQLCDLGYPTTRYSGAAFKVDVIESDGSVRGLDVFGGFLMAGYLHLMGEIRTPFKREWIFPLATATLEGRSFPVPADADRFLVATYGPHWRTPDPAFKFKTPESTHRRLNGWFRGIRVHRGAWDGRYTAHPEPPSLEPSDLVRYLAEREADDIEFVDIGCGWGVDARWMATRGVVSFGVDHAPKGFEHLAAETTGSGLPLTYLPMNLLELRSVLSVSALLANRPQTPGVGDGHLGNGNLGNGRLGDRVLMARHLVDAIDSRARANLWRSASMLLRGGGRLYLEFLAERGADNAAGPYLHPLLPRRVRGELEEAGARLVHREILLASTSNPDVEASQICRMVAQWDP